MYTYQDYANDNGTISGKLNAIISNHKQSEEVRTAILADEYDHQRNTTIMHYVRKVFDGRVTDSESANRLCSNFFRRLNTQRNTYSLGNGVYFEDMSIKERLGVSFDTRMKTAGYYALIHKVSFIFWNVDHIHVFPLTEFAPLWDEETGALRAGVRYWQIDKNKPVYAVLYEEDGYTKYKAGQYGGDFERISEKKAYRVKIQKGPEIEDEIIAEENYPVLPIIPLYGSDIKQSTLVGMRGKIDAYDLIRSGYANDLQECAEIYWIVTNAGGMDDEDLRRFRNRLKHDHIANVEDADEVNVTPYTQDVPFESREAFLNNIRAGIYEDFGGLDVHTIAASATNDHIDAAYQPMDENADEYEYQLIDAIQNLLKLQGIEGVTPTFKRNRISNLKEQTDMILSAAEYLDEETILNKLPFLTPDEVEHIMLRKDEEAVDTYTEPEEEPIEE